MNFKWKRALCGLLFGILVIPSACYLGAAIEMIAVHLSQMLGPWGIFILVLGAIGFILGGAVPDAMPVTDARPKCERKET